MSAGRDILLIATREAGERVRSKAFIASTALTVLMLGFAMAVAALSDDGPPRYDVGLVGDGPTNLATAIDAAAAAAGADVETAALRDSDAAARRLEANEIDAAIIDGDTIRLAENAAGQLETILDIGLRQALFLDALESSGLDDGDIRDLLATSSQVSIEREGPTVDTSNEGVAFAAIVLLFVVITTYGQWVLMGVLEEKSTRVVELVVSSTSVRNLLAGKVIGIGVLGIGQLALLAALALVGGGVFGLFALPGGAASTVVWSLIWFVLGFAFYAVLYAAAGSLVSRTEDAQAAALPIALVGVAGYLLTFVTVLRDPDGLSATLLSLLPPVAPIAYPARIAFTGVPLWELLMGAVVMILSVVVVVRLAARVYAGALLTAGGRVKVGQAWRAAGDLVTSRD